MTGVNQAFSRSYAEARQKFLAAAGAAGLRVESRLHPRKGLQGEDLAMDVVREGDAGADKVLIVSSACHGVEGFCGSGVQVAALGDAALRARAAERGVALLHIHGLNPFGFSYFRRTTHENVDLNRNFHDFSQPLPVNAGYRELHALMVPPQWPPGEDNARAIAGYIARHGEKAYQAAVSGGQHEFADGLFYGGRAPTWSNETVREVLRAHGRRAGRLAWIDLHTGLGPNGVGERIYAGRNDPAALARTRRWWDGGGRTPITSFYDGSSTSAVLTGLMFGSVFDECPQAEYTGIALEYGTVPILETLQALRGEQWLNAHPEAPADQAAAIRQRMMDAFYTDTDDWRERIVAQAREAILQGIDGLAG
ncbi:MAG: M14 family metallopeptidase [Burkholderiales bacterium]|nr:M14 family metallopeptidase [Burkholderiales bacterium]